MRTILLCGFAAFPGAPQNPTARLARQLDGAMIRHDVCVRGRVLPVEWDGSWPALKRAIEDESPAAVLLFGLHVRAERLRLELVARNRRELGRADAAGAFPAGPAVGDGPDELATRLPLAACAAALREAGVSFEWSRNAGAYLCNDTLYRLARAAGDLGVERFGFVHVPLTDECVEATLEAGGLPEVFCSLSEGALERAARALLGVV
ncbi:pyroglutamyl-peptidase I family protein [Antarcticirhabdus aurantiaca]|uniref:Uncharacterized protein n=1 Tax=Antarcticirhabdus aurantiaca TaxID=2606717 RepID=A0ACD4NTP4_9HYPH|nr:pyrrolidone-carboxylate peptidase [Antarcticirhabdus aurantiaca]WAJ30086.1 hypothetical protein OXU80_07735 [Jeongeuplla avenae]